MNCCYLALDCAAAGAGWLDAGIGDGFGVGAGDVIAALGVGGATDVDAAPSVAWVPD